MVLKILLKSFLVLGCFLPLPFPTWAAPSSTLSNTVSFRRRPNGCSSLPRRPSVVGAMLRAASVSWGSRGRSSSRGGGPVLKDENSATAPPISPCRRGSDDSRSSFLVPDNLSTVGEARVGGGGESLPGAGDAAPQLSPPVSQKVPEKAKHSETAFRSRARSSTGAAPFGSSFGRSSFWTSTASWNGTRRTSTASWNSERLVLSAYRPLADFQSQSRFAALPSIARQLDVIRLDYGYSGYRKSAGDGSCYYRTVGFALLERLLLGMAKAVDSGHDYYPVAAAAPYKKSLDDTSVQQLERFRDLLVGLVKNASGRQQRRRLPAARLLNTIDWWRTLHPVHALRDFYREFRHSMVGDDALVGTMRLLVAQYMVKNAKVELPDFEMDVASLVELETGCKICGGEQDICGGGVTVEDYVAAEVLRPGAWASDLAVRVLPLAIGAGVRIFNLAVGAEVGREGGGEVAEEEAVRTEPQTDEDMRTETGEEETEGQGDRVKVVLDLDEAADHIIESGGESPKRATTPRVADFLYRAGDDADDSVEISLLYSKEKGAEHYDILYHGVLASMVEVAETNALSLRREDSGALRRGAPPVNHGAPAVVHQPRSSQSGSTTLQRLRRGLSPAGGCFSGGKTSLAL